MSESQSKVKIVGLGGSIKANSRSLTVLNLALQAARDAGAETTLLDINELNLPLYRPDLPVEAFPDPANVQAYLANFQQADGFIWCPPTYHATPSGAFKNALDFLELLPRRPKLYLTGKVVALLTVAGGQNYGGNSLDSLIQNARALRLLVVPGSFHISPGKRLFDPEGRLADEKVVQQVAELGAEVVKLARLLKNNS